MTAVASRLNHEVGNESGSWSIEISWFVAFSRKRRLCKVLYKLAVAFWEPVNQVGYSPQVIFVCISDVTMRQDTIV
jgi:hypothetical protein